MPNKLRFDLPISLLSDGVTQVFALNVNNDIPGGKGLPGNIIAVELHPTDTPYVNVSLNGAGTVMTFTWTLPIPPNGHCRCMLLYITLQV